MSANQKKSSPPKPIPSRLAPSKRTPARGRSHSSNTITIEVPQHSKGRWVSVGILLLLLLTLSISSFVWLWFVGYVTTIAGTGRAGYRDGNAKQVQLYNPKGIAIDQKGNLYIADTGNHRIRKMTPQGLVSTIAGNGLVGTQDGKNNHAQFHSPRGIVIDQKGNLYIADTGNHRIRKITPQGLVSTIAGSKAGYRNGVGIHAELHTPTSLLLTQKGELLITDSLNHRIRKIDKAHYVSTFAGNGTAGNKNGSCKRASFQYPSGITQTPDGTIYITDEYNHQIRRISHKQVITAAGTGDAGFNNGAPAWAMFAWPSQITSDAAGNLFVADWGNDKIRKITMNLLGSKHKNP